jgi:hypothetical protein
VNSEILFSSEHLKTSLPKAKAMHVLADENVVAQNVLIKFKGLYDYEGVYRFMWDWLERHRYRVHEDRYKDKLFTALGTEIEPKWTADRKVDEYVQYIIVIEWHLWDAKDVEIDEGGVKKKLTTGRMTIILKGTVNLDYGGIFKGKGFIPFLGNVYKKMRKREIENVFLQGLEDEVFMLQSEIKNYLNMHGKEQAYY